MKLIIEIDEKCYESVRYYDGEIMNEWKDHIGCAVFNAIPFDSVINDIKTEIGAKVFDIKPNTNGKYFDGVDAVMDIVNSAINKHINKLSIIEDIKAEIEKASFEHYFEFGEYIGEDCRKEKIVYLDNILEIIDKHISKKD